MTVTVTGELDLGTLDPLSACVAEQLDGGALDVTLDLGALSFMDSSGLRLLIELYDRARGEGWTLHLIAPRDRAAALVLRATGADVALPFEQPGTP